jgi:hypothetical protein
MSEPATQVELLRIFLGEDDRADGKLLYEAIVEAAHDRGLNGATVLRGISGYQSRQQIHHSRILRLSEDLPIVIEIVDQADKIEAFIPVVDGMLLEGLVTVEKVRVVINRSHTE